MPNIYTYTGRFVLSGWMILWSLGAVAQNNAPVTGSRPAATAATVPAAYTNPTINYIRTWEPSMPTTDPLVVTATARTVKEVKQTTQYFDGFGPPASAGFQRHERRCNGGSHRW